MGPVSRNFKIFCNVRKERVQQFCSLQKLFHFQLTRFPLLKLSFPKEKGSLFSKRLLASFSFKLLQRFSLSFLAVKRNNFVVMPLLLSVLSLKNLLRSLVLLVIPFESLVYD